GFAEPMRERPRQQTVSEPGILWQQRPVKVATDRAFVDRPLGTVFAVVSGADENTTQRLEILAKVGPTGVILEADERTRLTFKLGLDEHVADMATGPRYAADVEESGARQFLAVHRRIAGTEQLVAAAH